LYGTYYAPISLIEAEGKLIVNLIDPMNRESLFMVGDVILRVNGVDIYAIAWDMLKNISYPNEEKALTYLVSSYNILRQKSNDTLMKIDILRDGIELNIQTNTISRELISIPNYSFVSVSHEIMEGNIGRINPGLLKSEPNCNLEIHTILTEFNDVDGLIIDLRQYPSDTAFFLKIPYFLLEGETYFVASTRPFSVSVPGMFVYNSESWQNTTGPGSYNPWQIELSIEPFFFDKSIVILMNERTMSNAEYTVMALRNSPNVTVIGSNSIGADGDIRYLPLPGGIFMTFTGLGIFTPDGGQTQRIGLIPDIYVHRTVEGIRDGRDELMEYAVRFLLEQMNDGDTICFKSIGG
jgi:C-terminal processing protease CtpA/Prc